MFLFQNRLTKLMGVLLVFLAGCSNGETTTDRNAEATTPDSTVHVLLQTVQGDIEIAVFPDKAPISATQFIAYVEGGFYNGASLYRSTKKVPGKSSIGVVQGGLLAQTMAGDGSEYAAPQTPLPPIAHESTDKTGIPNERGTIAYARLAPGSAGSEFFFNMIDNEVLDTGKGGPDRDGHGYATFGRVVNGMDVLDAIQDLPTDGAAGMEMLQGQILTEPVIIHRASIVNKQGG